jgi:hypothetical protein
MAIPLQTGKSLENLLSVLKLMLLIAINTIKRMRREKLTPIQRPKRDASIEVA